MSRARQKFSIPSNAREANVNRILAEQNRRQVIADDKLVMTYFGGSKTARKAAADHPTDYRFVRDFFGRAIFFGSLAQVDEFVAGRLADNAR